ncbi:MAG: glycine cleavage system aminomethyltransferase GcvT [Flavobacteriaceae bacterium]|jgi:aminomethyltransferase|nr:glycine cleavage system aminomethyltransferase GcvT [Flavobacteriaceae bacterium]
MKSIPLLNTHINLGAKMVPFAGYNMPLYYSSIKEEHLAVRNNAGVFDVSHMGEFIIEGDNAEELIQYISSNDISKISPGMSQYTVMPNENGGVVDDLIIYQLEERKYMMVVNASNIEKDLEWIKKQNLKFGTKIHDMSNEFSLLALQGPNALKIIQNLTEENLFSLKSFEHISTSFAGYNDVIISKTGYTGSGGVEIYFPSINSNDIWNSILNVENKNHILPIGLGARDTLRLEMGYCLYGNELDEKRSPVSAGLEWIIKRNKKFINSNNLLKQIDEGPKETLIGFELLKKGIPRSSYSILNQKEEKIGIVTSGMFSPLFEKGMGLGYVQTKELKNIKKIKIDIRGKTEEAKIIKMPFYKK